MRKITIKDIDYLVPGTWDEMTAEQLCFLANILNSKSTVQEAKVKMLLFCLSVKNPAISESQWNRLRRFPSQRSYMDHGRATGGVEHHL